MNEKVTALIDSIRELESRLETEFAASRRGMGYHIRRGRIEFEARFILLHRRLRKSLAAFVLDSELVNLLTSPVIYSMLIPLAFLDLMLTVYQAVCFPGYGIAKVDRSSYIVHDRHRLAYLNGLEKLNCFYCGYANGLIAYAREIAGRTEQYFCPIKHALRVLGTHRQYAEFFEYGDAEGYRKDSAALRARLKTEPRL